MNVSAQKEKESELKTSDAPEINVPKYDLPITVIPNIEVTLSNMKETGVVQYSVFPNPSTGVVYLQTNEKIVGIDIIGTDGKKINYRSDTYALLDLSYLPKGLYLMIIATDSGKFIQEKLLIR